MPTSLTSLVVTRDHAVPIESLGGTAIVKVDSTGGTVFYSENPQVSASQNQGSIAPGGTQSFQQPTMWLISNGTAGCSVQVVPGGGVGSFIQVAPSGDTTGTTDVTTINAALASYTTVQLRGFYYINATLLMPSNTTLSLTDATIFLVNQSNCNMLTNSDPLNLAGGNKNISIVGNGIALFDANSAGQTYSAANTAPAQSYKGHTIILSHVTDYIVSNIQLQHITYYGISPQQATDGYISNIYAKLAGPLTSAVIQTMGAINRLTIDGVRGQSEDDSIALSTGDLYSAFYIDQTLVGPLAGNVSDVTIRNVDIYHNTTFPRCHLICVFTGSGCTMQRITLDNIHQRFPTQNQGQIGIGVSNYFIAAPSNGMPSPSDLSDISISNTNARLVFSSSCSNVRVDNVTIPNQAIAVDIPPFLFTGSQGNANYRNIAISNVHYNGPATSGSLVKFDTVSGPLYPASAINVSGLKLSNIHCNNSVPSLITNAGANITGLQVRGVDADSFSSGIFATGGSGTVSGRIDDVNVQANLPNPKWGNSALNVALGPNTPLWTSSDPTMPTVDGGWANTDSTLVLDGGTAQAATYLWRGLAVTNNAPALIAHQSASFASPSSGCTTAAINTTGATLIVATGAYFSNAAATFSDSAANTWTALPTFSTVSTLKNLIYYCIAPTTNAAHTFSFAGSNIFGCIAVAAYSGTGPALDQKTGCAQIASSTGFICPGLVAPSHNNEIVVTGLVSNASTVAAIDSGFTILDQITGTANHQHMAFAHLIQTTAVPVSPTWSGNFSPNGGQEASSIATFGFTTGSGGAWTRFATA